jgi:hypothetical protein
MNCKPGDLAFIVDSQFPENLGRVVEVISAYGDFRDEGFCWNVIAKTAMKGEGEIDGRIMYLREGFIPDVCLRPISGAPVNDEVTDDIKEPA